MKNGQLKPAYNTTLAVDAEYIVGVMVPQERSDTGTFIPMMEKLPPLGYTKPVADAHFGSEENYTCCEENGQLAFIKPANHDQSKTRKYKSDIGKQENMPYDAENDVYICHVGNPLHAAYEKKTKSKAGYPIVATVYSCAHCESFPYFVVPKTGLIQLHRNVSCPFRTKRDVSPYIFKLTFCDTPFKLFFVTLLLSSAEAY